MSLQHKKWEKNNITKAIWHWELLLFWITNATSQRWKISTLFWGTSGICVYSPRRCAPRWINHISPRCLKITYTKLDKNTTTHACKEFRPKPQWRKWGGGGGGGQSFLNFILYRLSYRAKWKKNFCYRLTEKGTKRILMQNALAQENFKAYFEMIFWVQGACKWEMLRRAKPSFISGKMKKKFLL